MSNVKAAIANVLHPKAKHQESLAPGTDAEVALDGQPSSTLLAGSAMSVNVHKIGYGLMMMSESFAMNSVRARHLSSIGID